MVSIVGGHASLIGHTLGSYEVHALIGRGAMGTVYLARDISLNRDVALKVLLGNLGRSPSILRRFHMEAQAAAPLRHPNIVQIYSAGIEDGTPYIAMEYVEGEPLDRFLRRQGRIPWQTALYIGQQVADALDCAHRHRVVHRDIKPANILLDRHGRVRLTDFGIANVTKLDASGRQRPAEYIGTPHYMSPEQCGGREAVAQSDLYALGVTLYYMISGNLPFDNDSPVALIKSITNDEPPRLNRVLPGVPDDVARLIAHLMAKEPKDRPHTAQAVSKTIQRLQMEKGGRSAMPEALSAFMREHTRIRSVRSLVGAETPATDEAPARRKRPKLPLRVRASRLIAAVAAVVLIAGIQVVATLVSESAPVRPPGATEEEVRFREVTPSIRLAELVDGTYEFRSLRWIGSSLTLLAQASGVYGSRNHGACGLLAISPTTGKFRTIQTPASPTNEPYYWYVRPPWIGVAATPIAEPGSVLDHAILIPEYESLSQRDWRMIEILSRRWDDHGRGEPVYRTPAPNWSSAPTASWNAGLLSGHAVPHPDGHAVCLVLNDPSTGANYLAEHDLASSDLSQTGPRLTTGRLRIIPSSVCYSPQGRYLAYLRLTEDGRRELMVIDFHHDEVDGKSVAMDVQQDDVCFSPDDGLLAVRVASVRGTPELRLVNPASSVTEARLGPGELGSQPWHTSRTFIVATHNGELLAIERATPQRRVSLLPARNLRVKGGAAVSQDGTWVAAALDAPEFPAIVFLRLDQLEFENLVAHP